MKVKAYLIILCLLIAGMLISVRHAYAQGPITISGIVIDETGTPLPGASVSQRRASSSESIVGVSTDINGHFTLTLPASARELEVTYIGYETRIIPLTESREYEIVLLFSAQLMDEVVVTGVFTRNANSYTGAVTTMKRDELMRAGNQNLVQSLKNLDPSFLQLDNLAHGSNPNAMPELQMRGQSSYPDIRGEYQNNPNQPLFILDGFETDLTKILDLDMNIVESITLLKDATAKAIYGSKAGNGVIVVETRKPEGGRMRINYNSSVVLEVPDLNSYNLTNAAEKLELERAAGLFDSDNVLTRIDRQKRYNSILKEVLSGVDTDWLYQPVRTGVGQKHALYLEGGDQHLLYGIDLSTNQISGVMKGSSRNTFSGGITLSYRLKNFLFRNKISVTDNNSNESPWGDFSTYAIMNPYSRLYDETDS
jgi:TonB-dependent SusC/RagA subfamily outer membrane receptor